MTDKNKQESQHNEMIDDYLMSTRVSLIAEVVAIDEARNKISVQPLSMDRKYDETGRTYGSSPMQQLDEIPMPHFMGIRYVPEDREHGLLIFNDVDISDYKVSGVRELPNSTRFHDYNDAVFIPAQMMFNNRKDPYITIKGDDVTINVDGNIKLNAAGSVELSASSIDLTSPGNVNIGGSSVIINGKDWDSHGHTGVRSGNSTSGGVA